MKSHYAGSIAYDNEHEEWEDALVLAFSFDELVQDMKELMTQRKNSEVHFACYKDKNVKEHYITQKVREEIV